MINQYHTDLAAIAVVDRAWRVQYRNPVLQRKPAPWPNLRFGVRRQLDRNAGAYELRLAGRDRQSD
jgi:hypothetical protein